MDVSRRRAIRLSLMGAAALAAGPAARTVAQPFLDEHLDSPPVPPFAVPLAIPPVLRPGARTATADIYDITQRVARVQILPGLPPTTVWTYNGSLPGPTIIQDQGRDIRVRQRNRLPVPVSVHLHGGDVPPDSDGHPLDLIPPGETKEYHYPGIHPPANLWYHDHAIHATGRNVYMGLAGGYTITNSQERALPLPKGPFDIPLIIQDKFFLPDASIGYPRHDAERPLDQGVFGDIILVNGRPMPFLRVARRKYRFRILNGSNARVYRLVLDSGYPFIAVQTEGGFLPQPVVTRDVVLSPSERISVVVDFSRVPIGRQIVLRNIMDDIPGDPFEQRKTRDVMRFDVTADASDTSRIPADLPFTPTPDPSQAVTTRTWIFNRGSGGKWTINGKPWDPNRVDARPKLGTTEIWNFVNDGGGWWHPVHPHLVEFTLLDRTRRPLQPYERGLKDTVLLRENEAARVAIKWEHFKGLYAMHCHNTEHEDHDMMTQFRVV